MVINFFFVLLEFRGDIFRSGSSLSFANFQPPPAPFHRMCHLTLLLASSTTTPWTENSGKYDIFHEDEGVRPSQSHRLHNGLVFLPLASTSQTAARASQMLVWPLIEVGTHPLLPSSLGVSSSVPVFAMKGTGNRETEAMAEGCGYSRRPWEV
ncbi:hypothetical protein BDZ91DRAFT_545818 [Kalaharituber pfeilii]|nr:hypothetical protein BDZ91DRAFT_545818 [Kalaharituber pfeilii]